MEKNIARNQQQPSLWKLESEYFGVSSEFLDTASQYKLKFTSCSAKTHLILLNSQVCHWE